MENQNEISVPVMKEFQIEGTWAPVTPVKPIPRPIYEDRLVGQDFIKESEDYLSKFTQQNSIQTLLSCEISSAERNNLNIHQNHSNDSNGNNIWGVDYGINLQRENVEMQRRGLEDYLPHWSSQGRRTMPCFSSANNYPNFSSWKLPLARGSNEMREIGSLLGNNSTCSSARFEDMSFGDLLAMNGSTLEPSLISERLGDNGGAEKNPLFSGWNYQSVDSRLGSSSTYRSPELLQELNRQYHGVCEQAMQNSIYQGRILSNFNSPPKAMQVNGENFIFAPPTPDSRCKANNIVGSGDIYLGTQQKPSEQNKLREQEVASVMVDLQSINKQEVPAADSPPSKVSMEVEAHANPDKGGELGIDLNKIPQKKPRRKRYVPKVIREKKPRKTPAPKTPKPNEEKEAPRTKRKYVRKNKTNSPSTSPAGETEAIDSKPEKPAPKSCKRSLNFDLDGGSEVNPQSIDDLTAGNQSSHTVLKQGEVSQMKTSQADINQTVNQALKTIFTKDSEVTRNLLENNAEESSRIDLAQSRSSSPCASSNEGVQRRGLKRMLSSTIDTEFVYAGNLDIDHSTPCPPNHLFLHKSDNHGVPSFLSMEIHKKKRTDKGQRSHTSSTSSSVTASQDQADGIKNHPGVDLTASKYYYCTPAPYGINAVTNLQVEMLMQCEGNKAQLLNSWMDISRLNKKKRSKGTTRVCNPDPLKGFASVSVAKSTGTRPRRRKSDNQPNSLHSRTEALTGDTHETPRSKRRYKTQHIVPDLNSGALVLYNGKRSTRKKSGSIPMLPLLKGVSLEAITERLKQLDINRDQNALVPYQAPKSNQEHNALVLYKSDGTLVPFEGPFDPIKKRRQRAKVDLDDETTRVWRLLLENIDNQGIDGTDEEKVKWWENERSVFHGRVDSFIARMRLVQGDRRFTPWKGSVLDSVIGVFLTQNVSDHLSSSAFMALAARFPIKSERCESALTEEASSAYIVEAEVCVIQPEESITWNTLEQPICDRNVRIIHDIDHTEEKIGGVPGPVSPVDYCSESNPKGANETKLNKDISHMTETEAASTPGDDKARDDATSSQPSVISSQNSVSSPTWQREGIMGIYSESNSGPQAAATNSQFNYFDSSTSFLNLLKMAERPLLHDSYSQILGHDLPEYKHVAQDSLEAADVNYDDHLLHKKADFHLKDATNFEIIDVESRSSDTFRKDEKSTTEISNLTTGSSVLPFVKEKNGILTSSPGNVCSFYVLEGESMVMDPQTLSRKGSPENVASCDQGQTSLIWRSPNLPNKLLDTVDVTESNTTLDRSNNYLKEIEQISDHNYASGGISDITNANPTKLKIRAEKEKTNAYNWDNLRKQAQANGKKERPFNNQDSVDWEAVRRADVSELAETIKERGMNNVLAGRIKDLLDKLVNDHGSTDLEWLRDIPPDKAKEYLLSFRGLGLKSVECVRLLTLHHLAFPVDTNVGRIAVRLGWVPLQPLPESLQLHLLEMYPILESIQKYLWPRLCKLDQKTLYELHYHLITFGKVFCTKRQPNCNACPLRGECRHFASAFASSRLALPGPEQRSIVASNGNNSIPLDRQDNINPLPLPPSLSNQHLGTDIGCNKNAPIIEVSSTPLSLSLTQPIQHLERKSQVNCEPIVEVPASPEPEPEQEQNLCDIEDNFYEDPDEIPTIELNMEKFTQTLQNVMQANGELQEGGMSRALVALTPEAASIPVPKLKNISRLRTEHHVYELPDTHPLLKDLDKREPDDPCSYLLAIWTPGETADTIDTPDRKCSSDDPSILCNDETCSYCSSQREANSQIVRGTLLIPCRTAMRGSFPLNGTYFQVNEVFADHDSSLNPINVPRTWLWNLPRRTVYFGTSVPTIFRGLNTEEIQHCFWRGYVCVRGFDQKLRAPRPLMARLHFPASRLPRGPKGKPYDE